MAQPAANLLANAVRYIQSRSHIPNTLGDECMQLHVPQGGATADSMLRRAMGHNMHMQPREVHVMRDIPRLSP